MNKIDSIKSCRIFSNLESWAIVTLADLFSEVKLPVGATLFNKGDESTDIYIVQFGRLMALDNYGDHQEQLIGYINHNEPVGEMSLVSDQARLLTIRAKIDSVLLKITQHDLQQFYQQYPQLVIDIAKIIVDRTHKSFATLRNTQSLRYVAVIAGNDGINLKLFLNNFKQQVTSAKCWVMDYTNFTRDANDLNKTIGILNSFQDQAQFVIFPITQSNFQDEEHLINYADRVIVLINNNQEDSSRQWCQELLKSQKNSLKDNFLVFLQEDSRTVHNEFGDLIHDELIFRTHLIKQHNAQDYARLGRFITGDALGLVISGGGLRAWYAIGILQYIMQHNITIDYIGGVSAGAIVAAHYIVSHNPQELADNFIHFSDTLFKSFAWSELAYPIVSLYSGGAMEKGIKKIFGDKYIEDFQIPYFAIAYDLTHKRPHVFTRGKLWEAIRSTTSMPFFYPPFCKYGGLLIDGAVADPLPVNYMKTHMENSGKVIAICLSAYTNSEKQYKFPSVFNLMDSLRYKLGLAKKIRCPPLVETLVDALLAGATQKLIENCQQADILFKPDLSNFGFVDKKTDTKQLIDLGLQAAHDMQLLDLVKQKN